MTNFRTLARLPLIALTTLPMLLAPAALAQTTNQAPQRVQPTQPCLPDAQNNKAQKGSTTDKKDCAPRSGRRFGPGQEQGGRQNGQNGPRDGRRDREGRGGNERGAEHGGMRGGAQVVGAAVAKTLGLSEQEVRQQVQGGKTMAEIAKARGVSTAQIHGAAVAALRTQITADVKAGKLTQAQADDLLKRVQADANFGLNFGRHGKHRHDGQGSTRNQNGSNQTPPAPVGTKG